MKLYVTLAALIVLLTCLIVPVSADGPVVSHEGKFYGMTMVTGTPDGDDYGPPDTILRPMYEKSGTTIIYVSLDWGRCEQSNPGGAPSEYDFSQLDDDPNLQSSKIKVCWIGLWNGWADKIKETDPERYWMLAERFVTAAAKYANQKGIRHFQVPGNEYDLLGRGDWAILYVEPMKHTYKAIKAADPKNIVIAGNLSNGIENTMQVFYDAGAKGYFDILDLHTYSNDPKNGVDIFQVVAAHRVMERNGDGHKKILLGEGWGPMRELPTVQRRSHEEPPSEQEVEDMRSFLLNGYRNMLTKRDIYDPDWVIGARFFTMNDNYGQGQWKPRAKYVDENGDGEPDYINLDGYKFPPDFNIDPRFFNGGLVDFDAKQKDNLLDIFPGEIPKHTFSGKLEGSRDSTVVTGRPYRLNLTIENLTDGEMALDEWGVSWKCLTDKGVTLNAVPNGDRPISVAAGDKASAAFDVTFPDDCAGKEIIVLGELNYRAGGRKYFTDCWVTVNVLPEIGLTTSPERLVLKPNGRLDRVKVSVDNNSDTDQPVKLTAQAESPVAVKLDRTQMTVERDDRESTLMSLSVAPGTPPGQYPLTLDLNGRITKKLLVEMPVVAHEAESRVRIEARLEEWSKASEIQIIDAETGQPAGKGWFSYDDEGFHAAFEIPDGRHYQHWPATEIWMEDSIQMGIDPLLDGGRTPNGGYRSDDYEYGFAQTSSGPIVQSSKRAAGKSVGLIEGVPFAFRRKAGVSYYEITFPWSELEPFDIEKSRILGVSVLINSNDGKGRKRIEWGSGVGGPKDPTFFIPVILKR